MTKRSFAGYALLATLVATYGGGALTAWADNNNGGGDQMRQAGMVGSTLEVHIMNSGKVLVRGAKVTGISGNTVNAMTAWGSANLNWAVVTDGSTDFVRRSGGASAVLEIKVGDFVSFQGTLDSSQASSLSVKASVVKDWSIQKMNASFSGTVQSVNTSAMSFVLATQARGNITVMASTATNIMKGETAATFADIMAGSKVAVQGVWDTVANTFAATSVQVRAVKPASTTTTIEGKIKSVSPLVVTSDGTDYTVNIVAGGSVLDSHRLQVALANFKMGDEIRVYGTINANGTIDATVIRDTSI
jgi:Domain of unknown function (DUF5666)